MSKNKKVYETIIGFRKELLGDMRRICHDISVKDDSFKYRIMPSYFDKYDYVLIIYSEGYDQAHSRGLWILNKAFPNEKLLYWIK